MYWLCIKHILVQEINEFKLTFAFRIQPHLFLIVWSDWNVLWMYYVNFWANAILLFHRLIILSSFVLNTEFWLVCSLLLLSSLWLSNYIYISFYQWLIIIFKVALKINYKRNYQIFQKIFSAVAQKDIHLYL